MVAMNPVVYVFSLPYSFLHEVIVESFTNDELRFIGPVFPTYCCPD